MLESAYAVPDSAFYGARERFRFSSARSIVVLCVSANAPISLVLYSQQEVLDQIDSLVDPIFHHVHSTDPNLVVEPYVPFRAASTSSAGPSSSAVPNEPAPGYLDPDFLCSATGVRNLVLFRRLQDFLLGHSLHLRPVSICKVPHRAFLFLRGP